MNRLKRKLILSGIMAGFTVVCLTATTYAWFAQNREVWTEEVNFNIENSDGLYISLDGETFYQDIKFEQIKEALEKNAGNGKSYEELSYEGVSLNHQDGLIQYDDEGRPKFEKLEMYSDDGGITYKQEMIDAESDDYITLDIYLRMKPSTVSEDNYIVYLSDLTYITGADTIAATTLDRTLTSGDTTYYSGDTLEVDPINAMRLSVYNHNDDDMLVFEPTNEYNLGSAAIEGREDDILHDKNRNAMYTYQQSDSRPFENAADDGEGFDTISSFTGTPIGYFDNVDGGFIDIKLTVNIWLEGWDADFFIGVPQSVMNMNVRLGFIAVDVNDQQPSPNPTPTPVPTPTPTVEPTVEVTPTPTVEPTQDTPSVETSGQ